MVKKLTMLFCMFITIASSAYIQEQEDIKIVDVKTEVNTLGKNFDNNLLTENNELLINKTIDDIVQNSENLCDKNKDNNCELLMPQLNNNFDNDEIFKIIEESIDHEKIFEEGIASFYGKNWNGRKTASGSIFNTYELTAAHKTLPFGTKVRVTNTTNGKSVDVTITDRGPFIQGRVIDLSEKAFETIASLKKGITKVTLEILEESNSK